MGDLTTRHLDRRVKAMWSLQRSGRGALVGLIALLSVHVFAEQQAGNVLAL